MTEEHDPFWDEISDPPRYYDRLGTPISLREWADLMEDRDYKVVKQTLISARFLVSTVWLGLDHSFSWPGHERAPLIFETMVFDQGSGEPFMDLEMERYTRESDARHGHERLVQLVMAAEGTEDRIDAKP